MSTHLMQTAEDERLMQAPVVDEGDPFTKSASDASSVSSLPRKTPSATTAHTKPPHAPPSVHTPNRPSASPSASSPLPTTLPYPHPMGIFQSNAAFLASNASPSQLDGFTAEEEFKLRAHTCIFMSGIGQKLKLGQLALATASVYVQVVFTHYSFKALDRLEIALTCLFLAGKVEERRLRIDYVLGAYYVEKEELLKKLAHAAGEGELYAPRPAPIADSPEWDRMRTRVYELESLVLDAIEYNFDVLHPYSYLRKFLEKYIYSSLYAKESDAFLARHLGSVGGLAQIAWTFINDSLRTSLCIRHSPSKICVVAIRMAMHHLIGQGKLAGEPVKAIHPNVHSPHPARLWHEELFGMSKKELNKISSEILAVLEIINETRHGNLASLLAVHNKTKLKSEVPLPGARDLMATLQQKAMQQQRTLQQQRHPQHMPQQPRNPSSAQPPPNGTTHPQPPAPHSDRKRPRSSERERERDRGDRHGRGPAYSPLACPPSPFIDAGTSVPGGWLPDLHKTAQHRESRERERDVREKDGHRDREHERNRRRSRSRSRRSRSRSRRRSHSRDGRRNQETAAANPLQAHSHASPALEEGEVREPSQHAALPPVREESTQSTVLTSPHSRSASSTLTKSCSSVTISSQHGTGAALSVSRMHSSVSMSNLSSVHSADILSGDILRMSSCDSPISHAAEPNEEDIMRDITREANSLTQERREEQQTSAPTKPHADDEERAKKRARVEAPFVVHSHSTVDTAAPHANGPSSLPSHLPMAASAPVEAPVADGMHDVASSSSSSVNVAPACFDDIEMKESNGDVLKPISPPVPAVQHEQQPVVDEHKTDRLSLASSPTSCKSLGHAHGEGTIAASEERSMSLLAH